MWERRAMTGAGRCVALLCASLAALSCGSLDSTTEPEPEAARATPAPSGGSSLPPAYNGAPAPAPTPTPIPGSEPTPEPSPGATPEAGTSCGSPLPPAISRISVYVHLRGSEAWVLDSTPLVSGLEYCTQIGFTNRAECPVRPEGHPQRAACELYAVGRAKDTSRAGPTWRRNGSYCTGPASGCENHSENQYLLRAFLGGTYQACTASGACGELEVDR